MNSNNFLLAPPTIQLQKKFLQTSDNFRKKFFYLKADLPLDDTVLKKRLNQQKSINKRDIKTVLKHVFGREDVEIEAIPESTLHSVYNITFKKKEYILKINRFNDVYHEFQLVQEYWINILLKQNSLPTLKILSVDVSRKYVLFDYMIMEKANGKLLHNWDLSKTREEKIFINLGEMIARIHSLPTNNYGPVSFREMVKTGENKGLFTNWENFFNLNLNTHIDMCLKIKAITSSEKKQIETILFANRSLLKNITPSIVHNDLSARNMFVDKNNMTTLIDWEDAISGDPVYDIASFGTFCYRPEHEQRIGYFLEGYKKVKKLPVDFEKRYWIYYLRVALLKTSLLARQGKLNKDQSQRIQSAFNELI